MGAAYRSCLLHPLTVSAERIVKPVTQIPHGPVLLARFRRPGPQEPGYGHLVGKHSAAEVADTRQPGPGALLPAHELAVPPAGNLVPHQGEQPG